MRPNTIPTTAKATPYNVTNTTNTTDTMPSKREVLALTFVLFLLEDPLTGFIIYLTFYLHLFIRYKTRIKKRNIMFYILFGIRFCNPALFDKKACRHLGTPERESREQQRPDDSWYESSLRQYRRISGSSGINNG